MRFDAYAGNVYGGAHPEQVAEVVAFATRGRVARGRPRGRYGDVFEVKAAETPVGWLGFDRLLGATYFECKGQFTPEAVACLRRHWPEDHAVSRLDTCEDFEAPGAFDALKRLALRDLDPRVKARSEVPEPGRGSGRTLYLGTRGGVTFNRLYEAGLMPERMALRRFDWVRLENEVRPPKSRDKWAAAKWSPVDAWGASAWSRGVAQRTMQADAPRVVVQVPPETVSSTVRYLAKAFRRPLQELLEDHGSWECVGREFEALWAESDRLAAADTEAPVRRG